MKALEYISFGNCVKENLEVIEREKSVYAVVPFPFAHPNDKFCRIVVDIGAVVKAEVLIEDYDLYSMKRSELEKEYYEKLIALVLKVVKTNIDEQVKEINKQ